MSEYINKEQAIDLMASMIAERGHVFNPYKLVMVINDFEGVEIVHCKDCKHYNPPHIKYNDGTRKDYPDGLVTVDIGMNVGGKCENSTTTMRTYCTAHDREDPDDFEELVIFRQPMEYCSFGEKAEKHQLSGETSTISEKESVEGVAESATTTDCISRATAIAYIDRITNSGIGKNKSLDYIRKYIYALPPVNQKQITSKLENAEKATSEGDESTMGQPKSKLYIPLNEYTVDRINRLHKNDCGDYFDEEWLYNELEQIAEILQLSPETSTNDLIPQQAAIDAVEKAVFKGVAKSAIESLPPVEPKIYGNEHNCIMTMFGECSYSETGCGSCEVVEKVFEALKNEYPPVTPKPIMTEEVREALMRLSMCAREECAICKYENDCGFDKQVEMATENMHIILNAFDTTPTGQTIKEIMDFIGGMNMVGEISNEAYAKISAFVDDGTPTERPKGEWEIKECDSIYGKKYILTCPECGGAVSVTEEALPYENFCRECGADMRGDKE